MPSVSDGFTRWSMTWCAEPGRDISGRTTSRLATTADLSEFLFGSERSNLAQVSTLLKESQGGKCFYCGRPLSGVTHVDHFIPWSRYRADLGHNFVLAHCSCNLSKGDKLAASEHLDRWVGRNHQQRIFLADQFDRRRIIHNLAASEKVAAWSYTQAASSGALAWLRGDSRLCSLSLYQGRRSSDQPRDAQQ